MIRFYFSSLSDSVCIWFRGLVLIDLVDLCKFLAVSEGLMEVLGFFFFNSFSTRSVEMFWDLVGFQMFDAEFRWKLDSVEWTVFYAFDLDFLIACSSYCNKLLLITSIFTRLGDRSVCCVDITKLWVFLWFYKMNSFSYDLSFSCSEFPFVLCVNCLLIEEWRIGCNFCCFSSTLDGDGALIFFLSFSFWVLWWNRSGVYGDVGILRVLFWYLIIFCLNFLGAVDMVFLLVNGCEMWL